VRWGQAGRTGARCYCRRVTPARRLLTPRWIAFTLVVAAASTAFLFMAWWQLARFESSTGSWQNLGYTLQWPFFAAFAVYVWWKLLHDTDQSTETGSDPTGADRAEAGSRRGADIQSDVVAERVPPGDASPRSDGRDRPDEPADPDDPELAAYNAYLAALHRRDQRQETP
jgi:DNA-binding transcriptional regulator of glucitol operon